MATVSGFSGAMWHQTSALRSWGAGLHCGWVVCPRRAGWATGSSPEPSNEGHLNVVAVTLFGVGANSL